LVPQVLPIAFVLIVAFVTAYGFLKIEGLVVRAQSPLTAEELKTRVDDLKWGLGLIVTAAGLFAIAQATAAWFSSQTFTKQAEETLARISEIQDDVELRFPVFSDYERLRSEAYGELERSLLSASISNRDEGYDWREDLYERMELPNRQKLLSVERFIGIEFLRRPNDDVAYTQSLQRLAHFYISKFKFEKSQGFGYLGDLERADYYLNLAYQRSNNPFYLNDLGLLNLQWYAALYHSRADRYLQQAEMFFRRSCDSNPKQQRAYYNLGVLEKRRNDLGAAISYAEKAARQEIWEETVIEARTADIYYNLACYYACLAVARSPLTRGSDFVKKCLDALRKPAQIGLVKKSVVDFDFDDADGDLHALLNSSAEIAQELNDLRPQLSRNRDTQPLVVPARGKLGMLTDAIKNLFK
jgi:tetratricopeptide (TPR) repeat protein